MKVSRELVPDRRAWSASVRDVVNAIGGVGSTRPESMPTQIQVSKYTTKQGNRAHFFYQKPVLELLVKGCSSPAGETQQLSQLTPPSGICATVR